jgi:hypothetical protein
VDAAAGFRDPDSSEFQRYTHIPAILSTRFIVFFKNRFEQTGCTPVIPVTQVAEIRRIMVPNQPGANSVPEETLSQKYSTQKRAGRVP